MTIILVDLSEAVDAGTLKQKNGFKDSVASETESQYQEHAIEREKVTGKREKGGTPIEKPRYPTGASMPRWRGD